MLVRRAFERPVTLETKSKTIGLLTKKDIAFQRCLLFGVPGRARTDDIQNHNLTL